jgi:hypothetical protein
MFTVYVGNAGISETIALTVDEVFQTNQLIVAAKILIAAVATLGVLICFRNLKKKKTAKKTGGFSESGKFLLHNSAYRKERSNKHLS